MTPAIETDGLTKRYGGEDGVLAVDSLDLRIEEGEIFGFLGPNGAGKSTTINMLLGFISPTDGSASVLGHGVVEDSRAIRDRIGVLPEGYSVFERLTAREHIEWVIEMKDATEDADAILSRVGIADAADRQAGGFSKGMRQRLALGIALVGNPDLLILDEPSSGLDPTGIQEMRALLREEADRGTTIFFSSHILPQVEAICDRISIMNEGRLVALDSIDALRDEAGGTASIDLELAAVPDELGVETVAGVREVTVDDGTLTAVCDGPAVKADVVAHVHQRATITDVLSEDTSLEELFNRYTSGSAAPADGRESAEDADEREAIA